MKKCNCGSEFFKAELNTVAVVSLSDEGKIETKKVFDEYSKTETLCCVKCNTIFKMEDLMLVKCSRCGKEFKKEELNDNGQCEICEAISKFDGLTQDDLIRKLLESEKIIAELKTSKSKPRRKSTKKKEEVKTENAPVKEEVKEEIKEDESKVTEKLNVVEQETTTQETTTQEDMPQTIEEMDEDSFIVNEKEEVLNFEDNQTFENVSLGDSFSYDDFDLNDVQAFDEAF